MLHLCRKHDPAASDPLRIVLVDDEEFMVQLIEHMIRSRYDATIQSFTSSLSAWEELSFCGLFSPTNLRVRITHPFLRKCYDQ